MSYKSSTVTQGRNAVLARMLWRATGMKDDDFRKPIIAIANSFTEFVPGHIHLKDLGGLVAREIEAAGGVAKEFHTIAVDDGIAMGHDGMLYSLPSRELIADSVEYMVNAHCADALVCISNCDKITPGMLMAALRLNVPTVFVSGGPMESGRIPKHLEKAAQWASPAVTAAGDPPMLKVDGLSALIAAGNAAVKEEDVHKVESAACQTCGSCSVLGTANSMNCLTEVLGLALPGNGTLLATHADRRELFLQAGRTVVDLCKRYYQGGDSSVLPRAVASKRSFINAMRVDVAMGGSTNTILHLLAAAREGEIDFTLDDIDRLSRDTPSLSRLSPATPHFHVEDLHRAGGVMRLIGELDRLGLIDTGVGSVHSATLADALQRWDLRREPDEAVRKFYSAGPAGRPSLQAFSQQERFPSVDTDVESGCVRDGRNAYSQDGGLAVLRGNLSPTGCVIKTAAVHPSMLKFRGAAVVFESEGAASVGISGGKVKPGQVVVIRYEGPKGGPGMQEMLKITGLLKSVGLDTQCGLITDGRFSGGSSGLVVGHVSPEAASKGLIGLIEDGDEIAFDIPGRSIELLVDASVIEARRAAMEARGAGAWKPGPRQRKVTTALKAYAALATSADQGAVRNVAQLES